MYNEKYKLENIDKKNTAVVCENLTQFKIVSAMFGLLPVFITNYLKHQQNCISVYDSICGTYEDFKRRSFDLIPAKEFIISNMGIPGNEPHITNSKTPTGHINLTKVISNVKKLVDQINEQDMNDMAWNSVEGYAASIYRKLNFIQNNIELKNKTNGSLFIGFKFRSKFFKMPAEITDADVEKNILFVTLAGVHREEWNLQHTICGFERGDYYDENQEKW
jgi:hypothetical protein